MSLLISVVIPTLNRRCTLEKVLPLLAKQTLPQEKYELLLCDSGSTDGTQELVDALGIGNLRLVDTNGDRGRGGARNAGIQAAKGDIILFTDADILADKCLLEEHVRIHHLKSNIAVIGLEIQVDSLDEYENVRHDPTKGRHMHGEKERSLAWLFFLTGNASVPRETLLKVGMFDENFTGYGHEDIELGYRLQKAGLKILFYPPAINFHWHPVPFAERCFKMSQSGAATHRFYSKYRDLSILTKLGVNPITLGLHALVQRAPLVQSILHAKTDASRLARELLLQFSYLSGYKEARAKRAAQSL